MDQYIFNKVVGDSRIVTIEMSDLINFAKESTSMEVHATKSDNPKKTVDLLLAKATIGKYTKILISIAGTSSILVKDFKSLVEAIAEHNPEAQILWGAYIDPSFKATETQIFLFGFY
jgi:cell division GTPase FtsZ